MTVHPLQPFDPRNFTVGALGATDPTPAPLGKGRKPRPDRVGSDPPAPWSFDPVYLQGALALLAPRTPTPPLLSGPLPPLPPGAIELDDLARFLRHPVQAFLRQRLGIILADRSVDPYDALPMELVGLERWKIGDRLLAARLAGAGPAVCQAAELARGELPPGPLGAAALEALAPVVERLLAEAARHPDVAAPPPARAVDVAVDLGDGSSVVGTVTGIVEATAREVTFSRVKHDKRLAAWARLLVLTAAQPEVPWTAVTIGQGGGKVDVACVGPLPGDDAERRTAAVAYLGVLVDLYRRAMSEPLPLYGATSAAYAAALRAGKSPQAAARAEWATTKDEWRREDRDPYHLLVLGGVADLDALLAEGPHAGETGPGWADSEPSRLGRYARRLWDGLLDHERLETPWQ